MSPATLRGVFLTLLAVFAALPNRVLSQTASDDAACFWDEGSGTCDASAVWLTGHSGLLRTPRANLLVDVAAGIETCAASIGDEDACASHRGICEFAKMSVPNADGGFHAPGACFPTAGWAIGILQKCVDNVHDVDPTVVGLIQVTAQCVAHTYVSNPEQSCKSDAKCKYSTEDFQGNTLDKPVCAPDLLATAVSVLGASGIAALLDAQLSCGAQGLETPCVANAKCAWQSVSDKCATNAARVLENALSSPALEAYLSRVATCGDAAGSFAACRSVDGCLWGKKATSTNLIPKQYHGDGGDGSGGWGGDGPGDGAGDVTSGNSTGDDVHACFPSYASIATEVAPALGVASSSACGTLAPLFAMATQCAGAGRDKRACESVGACSYEELNADENSDSSENNGKCAIDPSAAMASLMSGGDAAILRAMTAACAVGTGNETRCLAQGNGAASAGRSAGGAPGGSGSGGDASVSRETSGFAYFVIFGFLFFLCFVAPPVAWANHLRNKGEDVCDFLPSWSHAYVPDSLRPQIARYESFVGQGDDL
jgi:hypothetical protein